MLQKPGLSWWCFGLLARIQWCWGEHVLELSQSLYRAWGLTGTALLLYFLVILSICLRLSWSKGISHTVKSAYEEFDLSARVYALKRSCNVYFVFLLSLIFVPLVFLRTLIIPNPIFLLSFQAIMSPRGFVGIMQAELRFSFYCFEWYIDDHLNQKLCIFTKLFSPKLLFSYVLEKSKCDFINHSQNFWHFINELRL